MHVHLNVHWSSVFFVPSGLTIAVLRLRNVLNEDKVRDAHGKAESRRFVSHCPDLLPLRLTLELCSRHRSHNHEPDIHADIRCSVSDWYSFSC